MLDVPETGRLSDKAEDRNNLDCSHVAHSLPTPMLRLLCLLLLVPAIVCAEGKFIVTVLNIPDIQRGAGLAVVLQTPAGKTWLYDAGSAYPEKLSSDGWQANFNAARDLIMPFLKKNGISSIDGVMISHAHYDHFGGLMWLADNVSIPRLIDSGFLFPGQATPNYRVELDDYTKLRESFKKRGAYLEAHTGDKLNLDPDLDVEVLAPPKTFFSAPHPESRPKNDPPAHYLVNANSLAIRIRHGDIIFYFPGDIQSEDITQSLLPSVDPKKLKCHILIAPGHGIHCTKEFAEATHPEVSIASVFPRYARGLKSTPLLKAVGTKTYITGLNGQVQVISDGKKYSVTTEHESEAEASTKK